MNKNNLGVGNYLFYVLSFLPCLFTSRKVLFNANKCELNMFGRYMSLLGIIIVYKYSNVCIRVKGDWPSLIFYNVREEEKGKQGDEVGEVQVGGSWCVAFGGLLDYLCEEN